MKKLLLILAVFAIPFLLSAQIMDTTASFYENFDGTSVRFSTSHLFNEDNWTQNQSVSVSAPNSFHSPSYPSNGLSYCISQAIPVNRSKPYLYLAFDQICKVNNSENSYIYYDISTGVSSLGAISWRGWLVLAFTENTSWYHGFGTGITAGKFSQNWYNTWQPSNNAAVPTNAWWKTELFDLSNIVIADSNQYFRIRFGTSKASPAGSGTDVCAGWFIDNVRFIESNCELAPPTITLQPTVYTGYINNNTGPFVIKAKLTDNDTINTNSILFWYTTSDGQSDTVANTITSNTYSGGNNNVLCEWTIPMLCYGTTVDYHIYVEDTHGSKISGDYQFITRTTLPYQVNDAKMESFIGLPVYDRPASADVMVTGQTYPIKVVFRNKGKTEDTNPNRMTSAVFGWSVNGVAKPNYTWTGDLCLDYTDTIIMGNHTAVADSNYIKVWIISRNGVSPLVNLTDDTIKYDGYGCSSALSGTYTLGGPNADFPTVRYMKERFFRCGFDGPVTININAGTYQGFYFDDQYPGLNSTNTLTFQPAPGVSRESVILTNTGSTAPVTFNQMAYVTLRNLTIQNSAVGHGVAFTGKYSHNITIDNCVITVLPSASSPGTQSAGIARTTAPTSFTGGGRGDDSLFFTNNTINNANYGITFLGGTNAAYKIEKVTITGNTMNNCWFGGVSATQAKSWIIDNNRIKQASTSADHSFVGINISNCSDFLSVSKNKIHMNEKGGVSGISLSTYANSNGTTDTLSIANNEIINKITATDRYAIKVQNSKQFNIYQNSCYLYSLTNVNQSSPLYITGAASSTNSIKIYNNIFYNASTSAVDKNYAIYLNYTSANALPNTIKFNNNEYYTVGNSLGWFVAPRNTFTEWQNAVATNGNDTTSVNIPINFISATDSLVPANFEGLECLSINGITTDIRGSQRYNTITFMGCYTRPILNTDLGIVELTSPTLGNSCPATNYPVKIRIKNTGSGNINFASKNATINYTIGSTTGSTTINTGTISPLQSKEITVIANFTVDLNEVYNYTITINIAGDTNSANNTLTGSFEIQAIFPYFEETFSTNNLHPAWQFEQIGTAGAGNWTVELGAGTNPDISPNYGLGRLFFNSKVFANNTESRAIMPVTILQGAVTPILEYWFAHDNVSSNTEGITVKVSTDGGTTYTAVNSVNTAGTSSTLVKRYKAGATPAEWEKYMVDLAPYSNQNCIYIAFDAHSNAKNNINIDKIAVRNFYNNDLSVNDIWALGYNPTQHAVSPKIYANISNEGRNTQTNFKLLLEITGANTYRDTITIASLASRSSMIVSFDGTHLNNAGNNVVRVYCLNDQNNENNEHTWQMTTTSNEVSYANDSIVAGQHYTYTSLYTGGTDNISYVNKYNVVDHIVVPQVKAFITNTANNSNIGRHFHFFVADEDGQIVETSDEFTVTADMENTWVTGNINNFALTNTDHFFYAGIEMTDGGTYLGVQEEAPLRDTTYYIYNNGILSASTVGRQMISAVVDAYIPVELALLSIENPISNCDLVHENIIVKLTNNGPSALYPGTPIHYTVNGGAVVNEVLTDTLFSHQTTNFQFNAQYDFNNHLINQDSTYQLVIWVDSVSTDRVHFNDTIRSTVISYGKNNAPTTTSPVHVAYHYTGTLSASGPGTGEGMAYFWYTNSGFESWDLQYVGNPYITPTIYYDTTYYVTAAPASFFNAQVGTETPSTAANNITFPFVYTAGYSRGKMLFKSDELNASGKLIKISLYVATAATGEDGIPMRIYVKNTDINALTASPVNTWNTDIADATLVYDGSYYFGTTGWHDFYLPTPYLYNGSNLLFLTETYCGGSNCAEVSGSTGYPKFNSANATNCVLYKSANNSEENFSGNYSTNGKRLIMKFQFVDAECQSEKVPIQIIADEVPTYDVEPVELLYPLTNTCTLLDENIHVTVRNLINNTIPAGMVRVKAKFNNDTLTQIVNESFAPNEVKEIVFTNTFNFRAPNADVTFNYLITTELIGTANYRGNDTLRGSLVSWKTAILPPDAEVTGEYLHTYTIPRQNNTLTKWFYENAETGVVSTVQSSPWTFTTPILYDTAVYYIYATTAGGGHNCETRHMRYQIDVRTPLHDISTNSFVSPVSFQCGISNPHLKVNVSNTWYEADTIPANTFKLTAKFTGSNTVSTDHTISQPLYASQSTDVIFSNTTTLGSTTQNKIYNYTIYSNPVDPGMYVYRNNDTISGSLLVPATPTAPQNITTNVTYGNTATITPNAAPLNYYFFYENATGGDPIAQGTSFTTPQIFANPTHYYYTGRISQTQFSDNVTIGTGNTGQALPFNFSAEHSAGVIMYTQSELGFSKGIIDTVSLYVHTASSGAVPIKLYLKNDSSLVAGGYPNLTPQLMSSVYQNNWNNVKNGAQLILDEAIEFNQTGWYHFVIPGGFRYNGNSLLLLTEHNGSATTVGYSAPSFKSSAVPNVPNSTYNKRVVYCSNADPIVTSTFTQGTQRFNTRFGISYACESTGRGVITINTNVPAVDLEMNQITTPTTPNNAYTNNETVAVKIKNNGTSAANNVSVTYIIDGQAPVTENHSGSIAAGATATHTFTTHADLSNVYFNTKMTVFAHHNSDTYHVNDTMVIFLRKDYCESGAQNAESPSIENVTTGGINNVPLPATWSPFSSSEDVSYTDYTRTVTPGVLVRGQSYEVSITNAFPSTSGTKLFKNLFIDFNRNGSFETTGANNERAFNATVNAFNAQHPENATTEGTYTVPADASLGLSLMRVVCAKATSSAVTSGCGYYAEGETEDYAVMIRDAFTTDLGVVSYHQPSGNICRDAQANIKVYVKNWGTSDIEFSETNPLTLTAEVTGAVAGTYTKSFAFGELAAGETKIYTIPGVNFGTNGSYDINTTLTYTPDEYAINNSWKTSCVVPNNSTVDTVSHIETFDEAFSDPDHPFSAFWSEPTTTSAAYKWTIKDHAAPNNPNAGPSTDHTNTNNMDKYAIAQGRTNQTSMTASTQLTSKCIDLHYREGYPIQMTYFEHIYGASNATATLYVEVSTGNNYLALDSVTGPTQTSCEDYWKRRGVTFTDFDEVAKVRFRTARHTRLMDIALDDINFAGGKPDVGVEGIIYPYDFRDTTGTCIITGDTIYPTVTIINAGFTPIDSFDIVGKLKVGNDITEITETWHAPVLPGNVYDHLMPGETVTYTFEHGFVVFEGIAFCDFSIQVILDNDENPDNDLNTIHPCASVGVEDYEKDGGVVLLQNNPNPATDHTHISFTVPESDKVVLNIYSVTGQHLYSESFNAQFGENNIELNTSNYAAGIYLYSLQYKDIILTKKMVIEK